MKYCYPDICERAKRREWLKSKMKECCKDFFDTEGIQGIENEPMQFCPYCGHRLTEKEFKYYNKKLGKITPETILATGIKYYLLALKIRAKRKISK